MLVTIQGAWLASSRAVVPDALRIPVTTPEGIDALGYGSAAIFHRDVVTHRRQPLGDSG
jgi:hypothetical protein